MLMDEYGFPFDGKPAEPPVPAIVAMEMFALQEVDGPRRKSNTSGSTL